MMYKLSSNNTTYTIPLDAIDLNHLSWYFHNGSSKPVPLWSVPSGTDYYEFKLNAWRIESDDEDAEEDADDLPSESLLCHVCNIHVPAIYIKEHNSSEKHSNMRKILDLMVLRGRNSDLVGHSEASQSKSCYYCEDCSLIVLKNNKESHESSYTHKKSLRNKNLIEQFLKFYSEDLSENRINNKIILQPLQNYFNKFINRKNLSFKISVINEDSIRIIVKENRLKINIKNFHGLVESDSEMICILCEVQVSRVLKLIEQHIESKKHRKKITRNIEDKHCIREFNDDFAHCILCNELVLITRIAGHKILNYHTDNLHHAQGKKVRDINKNFLLHKETGGNMFVKYLRDELADYDNDLSEDSSEEYRQRYNPDKVGSVNHVCNDTSILNRTCPTYADTKYFENNKIGNTYVQLQSSLNNDVEKNIRINISGHLDDAKDDPASTANVTQVTGAGKTKSSEENITIETETTQQIAENIQDSLTEAIEIPSDFMEKISYLILDTNTEKEIICKVCSVLMSNSDLNTYNHFNGEDHTTKYNELLKTNRVTKAQNKFFCYSCKVSITSKNELEHIFGTRHRNNFYNKDTDSTKVFCEFCKVRFSESVLEHQNTNKHLQAIMCNGKTVQEQILGDDESSDDTEIQSDDEPFEESDIEHINVTSVAKTENIPAVFLKLHYHVAKTPNPSDVLCKICDLVLPNSVVAIDTHIEGFYHTNKYTCFLKSNRLERDGFRFHCKICDVFITVKNEIQHVMGVKHKSWPKVTDIQTPDDTDSPTSDDEIASASAEESVHSVQTLPDQLPKNIETTDKIAIQTDDDESIQVSNTKAVNVTSTEKTENIQEDFLESQYHVTKTSNPSEVICIICNVVLSNSVINIDAHVKGSKHSYKYKILLESNSLEKDNNRFHCGVCDVFIGNKNEIEHIFGSKHKSNLPNQTTPSNDILCSDCDKPIPSSLMDMHLQSMEHLNMAMYKFMESVNKSIVQFEEKLRHYNKKI